MIKELEMSIVKQQAFTLIEVVMTVVILMILASIAIPRFVDLTGSTQTALVQNTAKSLAFANTTNYESCNTVKNVITPGQCIAITKCSDIIAAITPPLTLGNEGAPIMNTYNLAEDINVNANGEEAICTLQYLKNDVPYSATYTITGAGQSLKTSS